MFSRIASKLTYANVIATLALFIALGGGAYAASTLPRNSVGAAQLENGAVTPPKLSKSSRAALKGAKGARGPQGTQGPAGPAGAQGLQGTTGPIGATGAQGLQGTTGPIGATGAQGLQGTTGPIGATGAQGLQGASGAKGATGANGATGPAGDPATADGPAVVFGNVHGPGSGCLVGAPSGVSTTGASCSSLGSDPLSSPIPADTTARDLTVTIPIALGADAVAGLWTVSGTPLLQCVITAGQTGCTAAGPSATIPAGSSVFIIEQDPTVTSVHFSYRLGTPGVADSAPTAPERTTPLMSIYRRN